ncbi:hypothetical protein KUTeg_001714 [Tegillarca granosa]|uniref:ITPR-interacting domain-containing protein n=1 Tax=Tegillarca granosa TaxID=220873 RepID=A0ABQ9FVW4_TEGGR|nr:hypothetical protein KUTeg_001714 [Tegillarca granosa]
MFQTETGGTKNLITNQLTDCSCNTADIFQHQDTHLEHEGNTGTTTTDASGCQPSVNSAPSYSDVNGNLSQNSSSTHTNGHIRSSDSKSKAIKMPGLINTTEKGANSNCNESGETQEKEMQEFGDEIQSHNGTKSPVDKSDVDDVQIRVDNEEDIPLGSEAANYYQSSVPQGLNNGNGEYLTVGQAFDKRLSWLLGSNDQNSFGSDFSQNTATSTSSDKSLDMILMERKEDPEMILTNLGFGGGEGDGSTITRIPERFLSQPSYAEGIDLTTLIDDDENLGQILQAMAEGDESLDCNRMTEMSEMGNQNYGNPFSSVLTGMKFLSAFRNSQNPLTSTPNLSSEKKETDAEVMAHPSILHPLNRDWLAKQGYYEKSTAVPKNKSKSKSSTPKLFKAMSQDAAERRKRFHQSKSTKHYSLHDLQEMEEDDSESKASSAMTSFDREYQFRSFATTSMSCDSFDSSDSPVYSSPGRSSFRRNDSLIDDEEAPVFVNENIIPQQSNVTTATSKIAHLRKSQVERLMSSEEDDGDYNVLSPQSSLERTLTWQQLHSMSERSNTVTSDDQTANQNKENFESLVDENQNEPGFKKVNVTECGSEVHEPSGNIGRMESIQSDSSGFAEADMTADHFIPETVAHHRHLAEETRLAQYALQRYKTELNVLETNFLVSSHLVKDELVPEEREEIDEFQLILSEVRKEIVEMEHLLANRIGGLNVGNDNFSPLLMMDIIGKMTDLLKEQIFQQKVAVEKDSDDEDLAEPFRQKTHQVPWLPEVSEQLYEIQRSVCNPQTLQLEKGLNDSLQEMRQSILHEVRQELHDNTKWLQKQLQDKDRELNRLKMEVMSESIKKGQTRKKHYYESDV